MSVTAPFVHGCYVVWDFSRGRNDASVMAVLAADPAAFFEGFCPNCRVRLAGDVLNWCPSCKTYWNAARKQEPAP